MNNSRNAKPGIKDLTTTERTKDNCTDMPNFSIEPVKHPVKKPKKSMYTDIPNTDYQFYYDYGILHFRSVKSGVSPIKVNLETYLKMLALSENGLNNYLLDVYNYAPGRWLARKFVTFAKMGDFQFFDIDPNTVEQIHDFQKGANQKINKTGRDCQKGVTTSPAINRKVFAEPEINKKIREALRRTDPRNRRD